ncbi:MAG: hypothetical protein WC350_04975 [Candidatus Micrarchaeia archaeon]
MKAAIFAFCLASFLVLAGCASQPMGFDRAYELALNSECTQSANLTNDYGYNQEDGVWWIRLKGHCNGVCVIKQNGSVEAQWMCLGAEV